MAAGVHNAFILRFIGYIIGLPDWQCIHVTAQGNGALSRVFTLDQGHYPCAGHALMIFHSDLGELIHDKLTGFDFLKGELRVGMQVAALSDGDTMVLLGKKSDMVEHSK